MTTNELIDLVMERFEKLYSIETVYIKFRYHPKRMIAKYDIDITMFYEFDGEITNASGSSELGKDEILSCMNAIDNLEARLKKKAYENSKDDYDSQITIV